MVASGWIVLDTQTAQSTEFALYKSHKIFQVMTNTISIHYVNTPGNRQIMVIYDYPGSGASGLGTGTGVATSLIIDSSPISTYNAARTLTVSSSYIFTVNATTYMQTVKGSLTFDSKTTLTQNQIDEDYNSTVGRLTQLLLTEGYTQSD